MDGIFFLFQKLKMHTMNTLSGPELLNFRIFHAIKRIKIVIIFYLRFLFGTSFSVFQKRSSIHLFKGDVFLKCKLVYST